MKILSIIQDQAKSILRAVVRFPLVILFLITIGTLISIQIESSTTDGYMREIFTLMVGLFLSAAVQLRFEKMQKPMSVLLISQGAVLLLTAAAYFLRIFYQEDGGFVDGLRAFISAFALVIVFLWIPSIRWKANFNDVFMSAFKAFFTAGFFTVIIYGGVTLVLAAVNSLLFELPMNTFAHVAIWIWILVAPILLLSLIPLFDGSEEEKEHTEKQSKCPAFLRVLLSFVLIPLTALYTVVLLSYLVKTIVSGDARNLLESLILSYSVVVILLYVLVSEIDNKISSLYRLIFPKIMALIALYQVVISLSKMPEEGVTTGRYFVVLFGIFSVLIGVLMSVIPKDRNFILAIVLTGFAVVSILPPVDAFTVSAGSQALILEQVLEKNNMIVDGVIVPNDSISEKDQGKITRAAQNLYDMNRLDRIAELPDAFEFYADFKDTFGFEPYYQPMNPSISPSDGSSAYFSLNPEQPIDISGYDHFFSINAYDYSENAKIVSVEASNGRTYACKLTTKDNSIHLAILDDAGVVLLETSIVDKIDALAETVTANGKENSLSPEQMTFDAEENGVAMRVIFQYAGVNTYNSQTTYDVHMYILLRFS